MPIAGDDTPGTISPELADLLRKMLLGEPAPNPNTPPDDSWWARDEELPWPHPLLANALPEYIPPGPAHLPPPLNSPWAPGPEEWGQGIPPPPEDLMRVPQSGSWESDAYDDWLDQLAAQEDVPPSPEEWLGQDFSTMKRNLAVGGGASLVGLLALLLSKLPQTALGGGVMGMPSNMLPPQGPNTLA